ncbi:Blp family class II bacteriocin [Xylella fastidiosa]|uniref:Blp family class II bacteriocin n=1 Tax=Xylella fastidiosa TaxID=2371 RepID=UPI000B1FA20E|nr:Blp family class II bacteriocin [Xylella fastidiosa]MDG5822404.1 Blp family class II bacteriocin [Xylella fastidiosa subsp. pauca]MDG5825894.1 Blp family class II bacteriocin [Xylella fastidiosa subsp. pauca]
MRELTFEEALKVDGQGWVGAFLTGAGTGAYAGGLIAEVPGAVVGTVVGGVIGVIANLF